MREMPDESVQCCVTSPPYWGLRDYGHPDQIGQEETPDAFVQAMVEVFREVRRVLKADGTCWLNLGDSHVDKSLVGIPWLVAMSLKADGWYLRQDIIWAKPNPMPESVTDRCTKSHEYIFLLTKSDRYYYDNEAIKEKCETSDPSSVSYRKNGKSDSRTKHEKICLACDGSGDETDEYGDDCKKCGGTGLANISGAKTAVKNSGVWIPPPSGRIKRSVWTVPTAPYKGAHFATYPPDLIKPCIMAGTKPGDVVLDPFGGSGTTGQVAIELGRRAILCELNPDYAEIIHQRTNVTMGLAL
jgi:site-specific DNA-methyltransferase (adenine-specific)